MMHKHFLSILTLQSPVRQHTDSNACDKLGVNGNKIHILNHSVIHQYSQVSTCAKSFSAAEISS
jgi:hypothetical protein